MKICFGLDLWKWLAWRKADVFDEYVKEISDDYNKNNKNNC